jgi:hypothetical protein
MPYFVFSVRPHAQIEPLAEFSNFKQASAHAKSLRATQAVATGARVKVMYADDVRLAEALLRQVRKAGPTGDD